jgi:hypothetical protein
MGKVAFHGSRFFEGDAGSAKVSREVARKWDGTLTTLMGGVSYEGGGQFVFFRPAVSVDYIRLKEDGYTETGGGAGLDLTIDPRTSDELAVNGGLTLGVDLKGMRRRDSNWLRIEGEGGWREVVGGALGDTTAHFEGGTPFTLQADQGVNGWFARLRAIGGLDGFTMTGEAGAEQRQDAVSFTVRGMLRMAF